MQFSSQSYYITTALGGRHLSKLKTIFNELLFYFRLPLDFLERSVWVVCLKESWSNKSEYKKYPAALDLAHSNSLCYKTWGCGDGGESHCEVENEHYCLAVDFWIKSHVRFKNLMEICDFLAYLQL